MRFWGSGREGVNTQAAFSNRRGSDQRSPRPSLPGHGMPADEMAIRRKNPVRGFHDQALGASVRDEAAGRKSLRHGRQEQEDHVDRRAEKRRIGIRNGFLQTVTGESRVPARLRPVGLDRLRRVNTADPRVRKLPFQGQAQRTADEADAHHCRCGGNPSMRFLRSPVGLGSDAPADGPGDCLQLLHQRGESVRMRTGPSGGPGPDACALR